MKEILQKAIDRKQKALSEYDSKRVIASAGVAITREGLAASRDEAVSLAEGFGFPVVLKGCSSTLTHKTETGMVKLNLGSAGDVAKAYDEIIAAGAELDGVLVQEMIKGVREFVIGLTRDPQFGPCVMFGLGGILTETLKDTVFRIAPLTMYDAKDMMSEIRANAILQPFRGEAAVDIDLLAKILIAVGEISLQYEAIAEIDINPLKIRRDGKPVAVDALIVLTS